jgi:hypothetical protein
MNFPVYDMQVILSKPVMDRIAQMAQQHGVHPTVVLNALLRYGLYEMTAQGAEDLIKLQEFINTLIGSTPIKEATPW